MNALVPADLSAEHFSRLHEVLAPNERDLVAVIESYFNDSGCHDGSPALTVAGFIFERDHARQMREEWNAILVKHGLPYFHMVDFAPGKGPYKHLSKPDRIAIQKEFQEVIYRHAAFGFAVSAKGDDGKGRYGFSKNLPNAFSLCCYLCLAIVGDWIRFQEKSDRNATFFFEAGNIHQGDAAALVQKTCVGREDISCTFVRKKVGGGPIQAADMFAWLQNNYLKRLIGGEDRLRLDHQAIVEKIDCVGMILDGFKADNSFRQIEKYQEHYLAALSVREDGRLDGTAF